MKNARSFKALAAAVLSVGLWPWAAAQGGGEFSFGSRQANGLAPREIRMKNRKKTSVEKRIGGLAMQAIISTPSPRLESRVGVEWSMELLGEGWEDGVAVSDVVPSWATCVTTFTGKKKEENGFKLTLSRLSPAALIEPAASSMAFRLPRSDGWYVAAPVEGRVNVSSLDAGEALSLENAQPRWLLAWAELPGDGKWVHRTTGGLRLGIWGHYAKRRPATVAFLFVFGEKPEGVSCLEDGKGMRLRFPGGGAAFAVLPLYGSRWIDPREAKSWKDGLPAEVAGRCRNWTRWLARYPVDVEERAAYEPKTDTVVLRERFTFRTLGQTKERPFVPILPAAAVAAKHGMKGLDVSGKRIETGLTTPLGSYWLVEGDSYEIRLKGLGKYALAARHIGPATKKDAPVARELEGEIDKILKAGYLSPFFVPNNNATQIYSRWAAANGRRAVWSNPGETLFLLAEALPVLPEKKQEEVREFLKEWEAGHPAAEVIHLPFKPKQRRERFRIHRASYQGFPDAKSNFHLIYRIIPLENVYYLARYHAALERQPDTSYLDAAREIVERYAAHLDWASCGFYLWEKNGVTTKDVRRPDYDHGTGGVPDLNRLYAAGVGLIRLGRGTEQEAMGWWLLARASLGRVGVERLRDEYYDLGIWDSYGHPRHLEVKKSGHRGVGTGAGKADNFQTARSADEFHRDYVLWAGHLWHTVRVLPWYGLTPELARFLRDHCAADTEAFVKKVTTLSPDWHLWMCQMMLGSEVNYPYPEDSWQLFMANAWILDKPAPLLESWLDVPWVARGDLYYIHKLAETIKAYRGVRWVHGSE